MDLIGSGLMSEPRIFLASVFDDELRQPIFARCPHTIWRPEGLMEKGRTIEDVCRELIRDSRALVALLDHRGGRALAFEGVKTPVTVLEIELIQALFQKMPVFVFILDGFSGNERLRGLVHLAERWRLAKVRYFHRNTLGHRKAGLPEEIIDSIRKIADNTPSQRIVEWIRTLSMRFRRYRTLDIQLSNYEFAGFCDEFDTTGTQRLIETAAATRDHAARLAMLWAAIRQLCSVPYTQDEFTDARPLWDKALSEWGRSAAWYGLHDDSPLGLLATVNTHNWIRARGDEIPKDCDSYRVHGIGGARARAVYSMANRSWSFVSRWQLLTRALQEVDVAIDAHPERRARYLA